MPPGIEIPRALLLACASFGARLPARRVAEAVAAGLAAAGAPAPDVLALPGGESDSTDGGDAGARDGERRGASGAQPSLDSAAFDARMRAARAVVLVVPRLQEQTLAGSIPFEIATRARQAGVPCYAIVASNTLDSFDERILDLQLVIEARDAPALRRAGRRLARIV